MSDGAEVVAQKVTIELGENQRRRVGGADGGSLGDDVLDDFLFVELVDDLHGDILFFK